MQEQKQTGFFYDLKMSLFDAFSRVSDYQGRTSRRNFWFAYIVILLIQILPAVIIFFAILYNNASEDIASLLMSAASKTVPFQILAFLLYVVTLPLSVRRFHDTDRSGLLPILSYSHTILTQLYTFIVYFTESINQMVLTVQGYLNIPFGILAIYVLVIFFFKGTEGQNEYGFPSDVKS